MRFRLRWMIYIALAVWGTRCLLGLGDGVAIHKGESGLSFIDGVTQSHTYPIRIGQRLNIRIPPDAVALRVLTNANIQPEDAKTISLHDGRVGWRYSLKYSLQNQLRSLDQREYHFRSDFDASHFTAESKTDAYYGDSALIPTTTRGMQIPLLHFQSLIDPPRELTLEVASCDAPIGDIGVRIYAKRPRPGYERPYLWTRISSQHRERLARAHVYPADLLTANERRNLLRWQWTPLAPSGVEDQEYLRRVLYASDHSDVETPQPLPLGGILVEPGFPGCVSIASLRLANQLEESNSLPESAADRLSRPSNLCVIAHPWMSAATNVTRQHEFTVLLYDRDTKTWSESKSPFSITESRHVPVTIHLPLTPKTSFLKMESTCAVSVRLAWSDDPGSNSGDVEPDPQWLRAYSLDGDRVLEYPVASDHDGAVMKFSVRSLISDPQKPTTVKNVRFRLLGRQGELINSQIVSVLPKCSPYDRIPDRFLPQRISEGEHIYLSIPPPCVSVCVDCLDTATYVTAYSRPRQLPTRIHVAGNDSELSRSQSLPSWFLVQPKHFDVLLQDDRSVSILIQDRPPDLLEDRASKHHWSDLIPDQELWTGRHVFTKQVAERTVSDSAIASTFYEISVNQSQNVLLRTAWNQSYANAKLFCITSETDSSPIRLNLIGKEWINGTFSARQQSWDLPPVVVDRREQTIHLSAPRGTRAFLSSIDAHVPSPTWKRRLACQLTGCGLRFPLHRRYVQEEAIAIHFFCQVGSLCGQRIRIRISPKNLQDPRESNDTAVLYNSWTILDRDVEFDCQQASEGWLLLDDACPEVQHYICYLPIGTDLPSGEYVVQIEGTDTLRTFVQVNRGTMKELLLESLRYEAPVGR